MRKGKNRILLAGLPKSGTTILTYRVADCFDNSKIFFEPKGAEGLLDVTEHQRIYNHPKTNIVTKCLYVPKMGHRLSEISSFYNYKIWIYRDLRDWIISSFMYRWKSLTKEGISIAVDQLIEKEENPSTVSFCSLLPPNYLNSLKVKMDLFCDTLLNLDDSWFLLSYENFVDNNNEGLNSYLGVRINNSVEVADSFIRVARSKRYNNWKRWFNEEDVLIFKNIMDPYLVKLGYEPEWELENPKILNKSEGSDYLINLLKLKNASSI